MVTPYVFLLLIAEDCCDLKFEEAVNCGAAMASALRIMKDSNAFGFMMHPACDEDDPWRTVSEVLTLGAGGREEGKENAQVYTDRVDSTNDSEE